MKKLTAILIPLVLAGAALLHPVAHAAEKVRFAVEGAFAPFEFIDASGTPQGFSVDIAYALCEKMAVECIIVTQDWDGLIPGLRGKRFDAIIASMSITPERAKVVSFTEPYYSNALALVAAKDSAITLDEQSLKGKTIGAQRATIAGQYLEDKLGKIVTVKLYDTQDNAYIDLANGRLDGLLTDKYPAWDWLRSEAGAKFEFKGDNIDIDDKIGIAVRKEDSALREKLNAAIQAIVADGTYAKINAKYFPFSIY